jgi:putative OPT family oligopeptide transporter
LTGVALGAVLNMGICYAGLQIGFTIVGSAVAAVLGFGLMRGIIGSLASLGGGRGRLFGSILEVNVFQTVASAVNTVNAGIIFTVPVMFLLGRQEEIDYAALILATTAGSVLGVVMIVPLRKQIIDFERLRFPEGTAVAAILKSPGAGIHKAILLAAAVGVSAIVSALTKEWVKGAGAPLPEELHAGEALGLPAGFRFVFAASLLSLGAGYLAGRPGLVVLYGTLLNYWILIPVCIALGWVPGDFADFRFLSDDYARAEEFNGKFAHFTSRHVGIGMILGGAIAGIVVALPSLRAALASLKAPPAGGRREEVDIRVLKGGVAIGLVVLFVAAKISGGDAVGWGTAAILTVVGGAWLWLAGLVVAQTTGRTDWSPLSGLALIAIAIMMTIMGTDDAFVVPAVTLGAAICVATSMAADMMADLKTGYLVGGRPAYQQIAQIATCWIGPAIALGTVILLWKAYAFGPEQAKVLHDRAVAEGTVATYAGTETDLPPGTPQLGAPQAGALQAAINIVQTGNVPLGKYLTGAVLGLVVSLLVSPGLGVMVGLSMYLPFEYMIVFGMGGITNILVRKWKGARYAEDKGVPIAAGLIVGDALVGVVHAMVKVAGSVGGAA